MSYDIIIIYDVCITYNYICLYAGRSGVQNLRSSQQPKAASISPDGHKDDEIRSNAVWSNGAAPCV